MKKTIFFAYILAAFTYGGHLSAHCQLPCGIYHDDMVFEEIDQYVETMYKAISVMNDNKFANVADRNTFVRWVIEKETSTNLVAQRLTEYFLQQKIKPGSDEGTMKKVQSLHKLLFLLVQIKQNANISMVKDFNQEWEGFKLMLHTKDYECEMMNARLLKDHDHDHDHDDGHSHDHDHDNMPAKPSTQDTKK